MRKFPKINADKSGGALEMGQKNWWAKDGPPKCGA